MQDLGPIRRAWQRADGVTTIVFEEATAYVRPNYVDYNFKGSLRHERAKAWARENGGEYWHREGGNAAFVRVLGDTARLTRAARSAAS